MKELRALKDLTIQDVHPIIDECQRQVLALAFRVNNLPPLNCSRCARQQDWKHSQFCRQILVVLSQLPGQRFKLTPMSPMPTF